MPDEPIFAIIAEKKAYEKPLFMHGLTVERLYEEIVSPYEEKRAFFIDGVPVTPAELEKIKIVRQSPQFMDHFNYLHTNLRSPGRDGARFVPIVDYPGRLTALFREAGEDVTSRVIDAYRTKKKLNLPVKDLVEAASQVLIAALRWPGA